MGKDGKRQFERIRNVNREIENIRVGKRETGMGKDEKQQFDRIREGKRDMEKGRK